MPNMKVRMLATCVGAADVWQHGRVYELDAKVACDFINHGLAEVVTPVAGAKKANIKV